MTAISHWSSALADRYELLGELGRGGMATVYLARDLRHDSLVAVKILHPDLAPLFASERFAREIRITAGLQHPHILSVLDSGEAAGVPFYTMPYVAGESLAHRLTRQRQLPIEDAVRIACDLADALAYAHARGFVHRDVKPANVLLSHGHAMIADFGIAHAMDAAAGEKLTQSGIALGTVHYMSPEQAAGEGVDGRTDIYALGCVLYEMLAGTPPFAGPTAHAIMARHSVDPAPSVRTVRATVSPALERVMWRALAKLPADRFASADAFRDALAAAAADPEGYWHSAQQPAVRARRRRLAITGLSFAAVALLSVFAWRASAPSIRGLDRNRVTVFPLGVSAAFSGSRSVGEDIATMIGHALDGTGPLRWIDGWRLVGGARAAGDIGRIDPSIARELAREQRSAFYLTGSVVPRGDSVEVLLDLVDVAGDSVVKRGQGTGTAADAWRAGLRAVNAVLPALVPGAAARNATSEWADRSPKAVADFLLGEAAFRRARPTEALAHYRDAVRADSAFALAAVRGAQAATWEHRPSEAVSLIALALTQPMSPRFAHFARGYAAYLEGRADSASAELRRALAADPEMATAWMQLGETYTHLLPVAGRPDTLADAAYAEALRLDPTATHLLLHPIESRLRRGRTEEAAAMIERFLAAEPDTMLAAQVRLMQACVVRGPGRVAWSDEVSAHPFAVLAAAQSLAVGAAQLPCAGAAYGALRTYETPAMAAASTDVDARRWTALTGLYGVLLAQGRYEEAAAKVDSAITLGEGGLSLHLLGGALAPELAARGADAARRTAAQFGDACERCASSRLWQLGVLAEATGDSARLATLGHSLETRAHTLDEPFLQLIMQGTAARTSLARRDTASAIRQLLAVLAAPVPSGGSLLWTEVPARAPERLTLARLFVARREFQRAIDVAGVFDGPAAQSYAGYVAASLALRAAAADSLGGQPLSQQYRRRLAALSSQASPRGRE